MHAADSDAHDHGGDERVPDAAQPERGPQRGGGCNDGDQHRHAEQPGVVSDSARHPHRGHAHVVHARHAEPGDQAGQHQGAVPGTPEPDDEQPGAHDADRDEHAQDRDQHVVMDGLAGDREPEHGDEVHHPDPGDPDRYPGKQQPAHARPPLVGEGAGGAPQAEERAHAGHQVGEHGRQQPVGEVMNSQHSAPIAG